MRDLYQELLTYTQSDVYPFHMPGHKRSGAVSFGDPYEVDITEIDGFDNLHHPEGILLEMQQEAAGIYGSLQTYFHVNGSSGGLLSVIWAATEPGDEVLVARNCHKAVYNGLVLRGLTPRYLYPLRDEATGIAGAIGPKQVREALAANPAVKAVVLVSPNYEGVVADISAIAEVVHEAGAILIVDEAHGAHLPFCRQHAIELGFFPESAIGQGADLVVQSLHKTMPALTQTALVHRCSERVSRERLEEAQRMFQTSSPSYVLMASMGAAIRWGYEENSDFLAYTGFLTMLRAGAKLWQRLGLFEPEAQGWRKDPGKIVIYDKKGRMGGRELYERLRQEFGLQPEMCTERYALLMTAPTDTGEGFVRLFGALKELDEALSAEDGGPEEEAVGSGAVVLPAMEQVLNPAKAQCAPKEAVMLEEAPGRIAGEYLYLYPPEIPLLVPGERVPEGLAGYLHAYGQAGIAVRGMEKEGYLRVLCE